MQNLSAVVSACLPVFLVLALGVFCRTKNFITRDGVNALKKVVINITLPFVLFQSFATADYTPSSLIVPVIIFLICCIMLALGFLTIRISGLSSRLAPFLSSGFEAGMLGFSLFALLYPNESLSTFAILVLGQEIFVFTVFKMLLTGKKNLRSILKDIVTSPTLIAVLLGLIVGISGLYDLFIAWKLNIIIETTTDFVSAPTGTIILLTVGYDLVLSEIPWKKTFGFIAMRLAIAALGLAAVILLSRRFLQGVIFEGAAILLFMLPPPYVIPIFADEPEERIQISSSLSALTLITMILFAVFSVVLQIK